jgi:hypothetical protein
MRHEAEGRKQQLPARRSSSRLGAEARPGSESRANAQEGYPGTWETSLLPLTQRGAWGGTAEQRDD